MKVKREMEEMSSKMDGGGTKVSSRFEGRLGSRSEGRVMSPRKRVTKVTDLREKLKKTSTDQVTLVPKPKRELEEDPATLARREKDVQYGKTTANYLKYRELMPKEDRLDWMPRTPDKYGKYSRRQWDGQIKTWKINFHKFVASGGELAANKSLKDTAKKEDLELKAGRLERWEEKLRREEEELEREEKELEREEAELREGKGRSDSVSSVSSWVDIMDEEEKLEMSLESFKRRSRASSCDSSDQGISCTTSGTATPRTLSGSITPDLHKDFQNTEAEIASMEDGEVDFIET